MSLGDWAIATLEVWAIVTLGTEFNQEEKRWLNQNGLISTKFKNFLKNSADKAQTWSYFNGAVNHGRTLEEIDESLASSDDNKQIAELLLRQTDAINRRERIIKAVENAMKLKYQPQIPEIFSAVNKAKRVDLLSCSNKTLALEG